MGIDKKMEHTQAEYVASGLNAIGAVASADLTAEEVEQLGEAVEALWQVSLGH